MSHGDLSRVDDDFEIEYPGSEALASECFVNLFRVGDRLVNELSRRLRAMANLSTTAMMVLATVDGLGGRTSPSEIRDYVPITSAAITSLIDTNEKRGLLRRLPDPDDRRKVQVLITREGRDLIDRLLPGTHRLEREVMGVLSAGEKATLLGLLEKIDRSVGAIEDEPPVLAEAPRHRPARLDYEPEP